jgi:hypothetical protein
MSGTFYTRGDSLWLGTGLAIKLNINPLEVQVKKTQLSRVTSLLVSLFLILGILVSDFAGARFIPAAHAQSGSQCGGSDSTVLGNQVQLGEVSAAGVTVRGVQVAGQVVSGVIPGNFRIGGGKIYSPDGVIVSDGGGAGVIVSDGYQTEGVIVSDGGGTQGVIVSDGAPCVNGVIVSDGYQTDGVIVSDGGGTQTQGVIVSDGVSVNGVIVSDGVSATGGTLTGDNISVSNGVITGQNLRLVGATLSGTSVQIVGVITATRITAVNN